MGKKYSDVQIAWLEANGYSKVWKNRDEFRNAFNSIFGLNLSVYKFNNLVEYYKIKICTSQTESIFTDEQKNWLIENACSGIYKNCKHLTDTYNALFRECRQFCNIQSYLSHWGVSVNTEYKKNQLYTDEMISWLHQNYLSYNTVEDVVIAFNAAFGTNKSASSIVKRCNKLGLRRPSRRFAVAGPSPRTVDLHIIRHRKSGDWIKVNMKNDKSSWIPLRKYVWEKANGKIPEGHCVVNLNADCFDVSLENLALIDRRGTVLMAKNDWWTDNRVITGAAVQWCNLYCVAKDKNIV